MKGGCRTLLALSYIRFGGDPSGTQAHVETGFGSWTGFDMTGGCRSSTQCCCNPLGPPQLFFVHGVAVLQVCEEPNAINLATCNSEGQPSVRVVLLKGYDQRGV